MKSCSFTLDAKKTNKIVSMEKECVDLGVGYITKKIKYEQWGDHGMKNIGKDGFTVPRRFI